MSVLQIATGKTAFQHSHPTRREFRTIWGVSWPPTNKRDFTENNSCQAEIQGGAGDGSMGVLNKKDEEYDERDPQYQVHTHHLLRQYLHRLQEVDVVHPNLVRHDVHSHFVQREIVCLGHLLSETKTNCLVPTPQTPRFVTVITKIRILSCVSVVLSLYYSRMNATK